MLGRILGGVLVAVAGLLTAAGAHATVLDTVNFQESTYYSAPSSMEVTSMAWAPDASQRLFVTRKGGAVSIVKNGTLVSTPFATISPVYTNSECGLLGIAFDPAFSVNGYVYFFVTVSSSQQQIIRYTASGDTGVDRTVIVSDLPTAGQNHDGGALGFGPDGMLYWGIGDLGNGTGVDANLSSLAAKIGRVTPDGSAPADNPFVDGPGGNDDRIWARGFRNPFTLSFQPSTGQLWVNTVGTGWEQVFRPNAGDHAGYNDYENNQPAGYLAPDIAYVTNSTFSRNISTAVRSGGVTTLTFTSSSTQRFRAGTRVTVAGVVDASFDGAGYVTASTTSQLSLAQAGSDASSTGGTVTTENVGGCITGGTFWDSSALGSAYRGNFFFGDFNSGRMERVRLDSSNDVVAVEHFATNLNNVVDAAVGPDGDLYSATIAGVIRRTRFLPTAQGLVVSALNLRGREGASLFFYVRLAQAPVADVTVNVGRTGGDTDVTVESGSTLTFTSANWSTPQAVELGLNDDSDLADDSATIGVASAGLATENVLVGVTDNDALGIVVSTTALTVDEGDSGTFEVSLSGPPGGDVSVSVVRESGDSTVTVDGGVSLEFSDANWGTPQEVTVGAADDADPDGESATLAISASGFTTRNVAVTVTDDDPSAPLFTTLADEGAVQGALYAYDVDASGFPAPSFSLDTAPSGMSIDAGSGVIEWTPPGLGEFAVSVRASNGVAPDATQSFMLEVVADAPPLCTLTAPANDAVVSGTTSEFFGDVSDDVGTTHAEFSVDGVVSYDDVGTSGHHHFGGTHLKFDTTAFDDGVHLLRMTGYDTSGQTCYAEVSVRIDNGVDPGTGGAGAGGESAGGADDGGQSTGGESNGGDPGTSGSATTGGRSAGASGDSSVGEAGGSSAPDAGAGGDDGAAGRAAGETGGRGDVAGGTGNPAAGRASAVNTARPRAKGAGCACRAAPDRSAGSLRWLLALLGLVAARRRARTRQAFNPVVP